MSSYILLSQSHFPYRNIFCKNSYQQTHEYTYSVAVIKAHADKVHIVRLAHLIPEYV